MSDLQLLVESDKSKERLQDFVLPSSLALPSPLPAYGVRSGAAHAEALGPVRGPQGYSAAGRAGPGGSGPNLRARLGAPASPSSSGCAMPRPTFTRRVGTASTCAKKKHYHIVSSPFFKLWTLLTAGQTTVPVRRCACSLGQARRPLHGLTLMSTQVRLCVSMPALPAQPADQGASPQAQLQARPG